MVLFREGWENKTLAKRIKHQSQTSICTSTHDQKWCVKGCAGKEHEWQSSLVSSCNHEDLHRWSCLCATSPLCMIAAVFRRRIVVFKSSCLFSHSQCTVSSDAVLAFKCVLNTRTNLFFHFSCFSNFFIFNLKSALKTWYWISRKCSTNTTNKKKPSFEKFGGGDFESARLHDQCSYEACHGLKMCPNAQNQTSYSNSISLKSLRICFYALSQISTCPGGQAWRPDWLHEQVAAELFSRTPISCWSL